MGGLDTPWDLAQQASYVVPPCVVAEPHALTVRELRGEALAQHRSECPVCFREEDAMRYEIRKADTNGEPDAFYFVQVANNSEVLVTSETYTRKADALRGAYTAAGALADKDVQILDRTEDSE